MPRMPAAVRYLTLHRLAFGITALTVLLTAVSAAAAAAFASSTVTVANRETLADNSSSAILVTAGTTDFAATSAVVTGTLSRAAAGLPLSYLTARESDPLDLPAALAGRKAQAVLESMAGFRQHAILVSGHWPAATAQPGKSVQACLPLAAAKLLKVAAGARLTVRDSLGGPPAQVLLSCTFSERNPGSSYWQLDPLGTSGASTVGGFTNYGPLITTESSASWPVAATGGSWLAQPDFGAMTATNLSALSASVGNGVSSLTNNQSVSFSVSTSLPALLSDQAVALEVARSQLLIGELILLVVAGATLAVAVHLLASQRGGQPALLKARGATRRQLAARGGTDALLLAVPAAVGGPLVGAWLAPLMARLGVAGSAPIRFPVALPLSAWIAGIAVAAGCAFVVALPWLRDPPSPVSLRAGRARQRSVTAALAGGADLAVVLLAAGASWELAHYTAPVASGLDGSIGIDPILVIAPVLALTAGTLVMLRLLPWLVRLAERLASRGRGIIVPAAAWLISRRALRQAGPALLTVLAVATAVITIGEAASWQRSVSDQARFDVGADTRIVLPTGAPLPIGSVSSVTAAHGVQAATPVVRTPFTLASNAPAQLLALNASTAPAIVPLRRDLDIVPAAAPFSVLDQPRPVGVTLPGRPAVLQLVVSLSAPQNSGTGVVDECANAVCIATVGVRTTLAGMTNATLAVTLTDGAGIQYTAADV
ncbi:MAG TPA: FtsX-like permease family protein, partial [Streptosporangiaceae bacterium]|nr:FtsX-like permease family protein [Streptosporangiaceae bacterium]